MMLSSKTKTSKTFVDYSTMKTSKTSVKECPEQDNLQTLIVLRDLQGC